MSRRLLLIVLVGAVVALGGREVLSGGVARPGPASSTGRVVRVVDGDTIHVVVAGRREKVRYIGVDTPEATSAVECFGPAATAFNRRLVGSGRVRLSLNAEHRDRYGRLLAYVRRAGDGLFVNAELVRRGYATPLRITPNVRHAGRFAALALEARAARRGLWRTC